MEDFKRYQRLLKDFKGDLVSSGLGDATINGHVDNIYMFLLQFLAERDVFDVEEGIGLLDAYFTEFMKKRYGEIPHHVLTRNITSLRKFYLFLEEEEVVPPGSHARLNEEVKARRDDWMVLARGVKPPVKEPYETTRLFRLVKEYTEIAPWNWLCDIDVFAVEFSDEKDAFFCVILGNEGESFGLAVYRGNHGLNSYLTIMENTEEVMENPIGFADYLCLDLLNRDEIESIDYDLIKESGVTFRGRKRWPSFTLYNPGYLPVHPGEDELRMMERILSVINPFLESIRDKPQAVHFLPEGSILFRRYDKFDNFQLEHLMSLEEYFEKNPYLIDIPIIYDDLMIRRVQKNARKSGSIWEVDISIMSEIMNLDGEIVFPAMLMVADKGTQMILKMDVSGPDDMEELQQAFLEAIGEHKTIPMKVQMVYSKNNFYLYDLLEKLSIDVETVKRLDIIPQMKEQFSSFMDDDDFWDWEWE